MDNFYPIHRFSISRYSLVLTVLKEPCNQRTPDRGVSKWNFTKWNLVTRKIKYLIFLTLLSITLYELYNIQNSAFYFLVSISSPQLKSWNIDWVVRLLDSIKE